MRYRITHLSRAEDRTGGAHVSCADTESVKAAVEHAAKYGERLHIKPVAASAEVAA